MDFTTLFKQLIAGNDLSRQEMTEIMDALMDGELSQAQTGAFLTALSIKGETIDEIAAAADSMRRHATKIDAGEQPIVDTCGTGGDGASTFNISTTAAFIAAGAGVKIAKHGNRSVSSKCGSADVLKALGVNLEVDADRVGQAVRELGIGFLFAPLLHSAMKHAIGPRRELGVRTVFNLLGPLTNPAAADAQVLGVFSKDLTVVHATVLKELGSRHAMVVHGLDGLDEISTTSNTQVSELKDGEVNTYELDPRILTGNEYSSIADLKGGEAEENAAITKAILSGEDSGPKADIALINAAAAIYVSSLADSMETAYAAAKESISSGNALVKLNALIEFTNK
ncbi:MAG: anthranilate phosphoribosyltransferase [Lentisphaeria bacterium]|nr:anthranilate phosphoribosyltransferase [Lentisphaeria bacterium]NQZ66493.1 anthranilate phosphoribosyltransferase [Lentisphaeria bacterium]